MGGKWGPVRDCGGVTVTECVMYIYEMVKKKEFKAKKGFSGMLPGHWGCAGHQALVCPHRISFSKRKGKTSEETHVT